MKKNYNIQRFFRLGEKHAKRGDGTKIFKIINGVEKVVKEWVFLIMLKLKVIQWGYIGAD